LHKVELADDIFDPFGWQPQEDEYITTVKAGSFTFLTEKVPEDESHKEAGDKKSDPLEF